jgi:hypothetical protein
VLHRGEQSPNEAVAPLPYHHLDEHPTASTLEDAEAVDPGGPVVEFDALSELATEAAGDGAADLGEVGLGDAV